MCPKRILFRSEHNARNLLDDEIQENQIRLALEGSDTADPDALGRDRSQSPTE